MSGTFELPIVGGTPIDSSLAITINGVIIRDYVDNYSVEIQEQYDTENQFEALDGTKYDMYLGSRRVLSINFNDMTSQQIQTLFGAIKSTMHENLHVPIQNISYIDPKDGAATRTFKCDSIPAATYFELNGDIFWKIPTITFTEFEIDKTGSEGGQEEITTYEYKIEIGSMSFTGSEISKDTNISMSVSSNGYDVGQLASCSISGAVYCKFATIIRRNDKVKAYVRTKTGNAVGEWQLIHVWFLKTSERNNANILSFTALDAISFLDNNYHVTYELDSDGYPVPQTVTGHLTAISEMVGTLAGETSVPIPKYCDELTISTTNSSNARSFVEAVSASGAVNLRQAIATDTIIFESFKFGETQYSISDSECDEFSMGAMGETINNVVLYCGSVSELPNVIYPTMYQDYDIYIIGSVPSGSYPVAKNTLEINAQLAGNSAEYSPTNFQNLLGVNFGTEFSVSNVKMRQFIPIGVRILLPNVSDNYYMYATSINYSLTENGVFASISGSARDISDSYYLGGMEKDMQNRIKIDAPYENVMVGKEGLFLIAPKPESG